jgi:hypothetical protein
MFRQNVSKAKNHILYCEGDYTEAARSAAFDVFSAHAHHIQHDLGFERAVLLEEPFSYVLPGTDIKVTGRIDAVMLTTDNELVLVDWKVRRYPYTPEMVLLDAQLYVYYHYLINEMNLPLTGAQQVQILKGRMPKPVTVDSAGYPSMSGYTTNHLYEQALTRHNVNPEAYRKAFSSRIKPVSHFIEQTPIDVSLTDKMVSRFAANAQRLMADETYSPVSNGYTCKFCDFQKTCLTSSV